jgi:hypothetical protein
MPERKRISRQRHQQSQPEEETSAFPTNQLRRQEVADQLAQLDSAIDEILADSSPAGPSVAIGQQTQHSLRPLSNEELWQHFRQQGGQ